MFSSKFCYDLDKNFLTFMTTKTVELFFLNRRVMNLSFQWWTVTFYIQWHFQNVRNTGNIAKWILENVWRLSACVNTIPLVFLDCKTRVKFHDVFSTNIVISIMPWLYSIQKLLHNFASHLKLPWAGVIRTVVYLFPFMNARCKCKYKPLTHWSRVTYICSRPAQNITDHNT